MTSSPDDPLTTALERLPQVEIVGGGEERIDPAVLNMITQLAQLGHLARLRRLEESKVPTGTWSLTRTVTRREKWVLDYPLIAFTLTHDSGDDIYVEADLTEEHLPPVALASGESWEHDAGYAVIRSLTWELAAGGTTATVTLRGKKGIPP